LWAVSGLLLVAATWRLWIPPMEQVPTDFPRVPLLGSVCGWPLWLGWFGVVGLVSSLVAALVPLLPRFAAGSARGRLVERGSAWLFVASACLLFLFDQHRLQPWAYHFTLIAVVFATCGAERGSRLLRLLTISIYAYSALGKFDYQFLHGMGPHLLQAATRIVGLDAMRWPPGVRVSIAALMPTAELAIAFGLLLPRWRRAGVSLAVGQHLALLVVLGPWGLGHEPGVLLWNVFFIAQAISLFWVAANLPAPLPHAIPDSGDLLPGGVEKGSARAAGAELLATFLVVLAVAWPTLETFGLCDHWLAWGLYSPRNSRTNLFVREDAWRRLPAELRALSTPADPFGDWHQIDIDGWSLHELHAPNYPQARFQLGIAIGLAERFDWQDEIRVDMAGMADRWTGVRQRVSCRGRAELRQAARRFWINAFPVRR
jgi:hypothetical protein